MDQFWRQIVALLAKDFRRELRTRELTTTTIAFSLLLVVVSSFAFFANKQPPPTVFPGVLWISIAFTGNLAISRTFAMERDSGCLRILAMIPGTWRSLYLAKFLLNFFFVALFETVLFPFLALVFDVPIVEIGGTLWGVNIVVTVGFCAIGTLVSAMLVHNRLRDVMMSLILYPLVIPLIIAGVMMTQRVMVGETLDGWVQLLAAMDLAAIALSAFLFRTIFSAVEG